MNSLDVILGPLGVAVAVHEEVLVHDVGAAASVGVGGRQRRVVGGQLRQLAARVVQVRVQRRHHHRAVVQLLQTRMDESL